MRGQNPDGKEAQGAKAAQAPARPVKLNIPTPEEIGLAGDVRPRATKPVTDWSMARQRLDEMGATLYRLEKASGGFRFVCALPHPRQAGKERQFEAVKATEGEAIRVVFEEIEGWKESAAELPP